MMRPENKNMRAVISYRVMAFIIFLILASCAPQNAVNAARTSLIEAISEHERMLEDAEFDYQFSEIQVVDNEAISVSPVEKANELQSMRCISFRYISKYADNEPWVYRIEIIRSWQLADGSWKAELHDELDNDLSMSIAYDQAWGECVGDQTQ